MGKDWVMSIENGPQPQPQPHLDDWVNRVQNAVSLQQRQRRQRQQQQQQPCIYEVPARLKKLHEGAYEPYMVSLGPYHHARPNLKPMEKHKHRALLQFLCRAKAIAPLAAIKEAMTAVVEQLKSSYEGLEDLSRYLDTKETKEQNTQLSLEERFLQLLIVDGCFILEVLRVATAGEKEPTEYEDTDPVFSEHGKIYMMGHLWRDMLLLENQLPMLALTTLADAAQIGLQKKQLIEQIRIFCGLTNISTSSNDKQKISDSASNKPNDNSLHILHEYIKGKTQKGTYLYTKEDMMWSAMELREGGVRFRKSQSDSFKDISFDRCKGILSLPRIEVDDSTESLLLNLMAFEELHVAMGTDNVVTSYVCLMDTLIDSAKDVELLRKKGIVQGWVGSDENVASLFNQIPKEASVNMRDKCMTCVNNQLSHYRSKIHHKGRASFVHTYLRNPWVFMSLLGALFLLLLTIIQDIYTVLPYYTHK